MQVLQMMTISLAPPLKIHLSHRRRHVIKRVGVISSVLGRRSPTNEESNRSLVHTANAHHLALDAAAFGAAVATSLPAVFFSMP